MRRIGVIGLGYVGFPLCLEFSKNSIVIGFDVCSKKVTELQGSVYLNKNVTLSDDYKMLAECTVFIVAVPTPVDEHNIPDLSAVKLACEMVGEILKPNDLVVFESTVYPGVTQTIAGQLLAEISGLAVHTNELASDTGAFLLGYSPERINPGDASHSLKNVNKVVSGSSDEALRQVTEIYATIVEADLVMASCIEVAEAAKIIENVQRDVNIALMNEFAISFDALNLNSREIFKVANTKWNFLDFSPGLVGGHCIGVDPYYFLYEISRVGLESPIIRNARLVNESMVDFVISSILRCVAKRGFHSKSLGCFGITFKKNCDDIRNSKNVKLCQALSSLGFKVYWFDPLVSAEISIDGCERIIELSEMDKLDTIVYAVNHSIFDREHIGSIDCEFFFDLQDVFGEKATWSL